MICKQVRGTHRTSTGHRKDYNKARTKLSKGKARSKWYHSLQKKDIWLRKFMQTLKLYLKETEKRPGSVLFGGFGQKRR